MRKERGQTGGAIVLLGFLASVSVAVAGTLPEVAVDLGSQSFGAALPFDVRFRITGTAADGVTSIDLKYECVGGLQKANRRNAPGMSAAGARNVSAEVTVANIGRPCYFPTPAFPMTWVRRGSNQFSFLVGPLHADTVYGFAFTVHAAASALQNPDAQRSRLASLFTHALDTGFVDGVWANQETSQLNSLIQSELAAALNVSTAAVRPTSIDVRSENTKVGALTLPMLQALAEQKSSLDELTGMRRGVTASLCLDAPPSCDLGARIADPITRVLVGEWALDGDSAHWWKEPVNSGRSGFGAITVEQGARLLVGSVRRRVDLKALIDCRAAIDGTAIAPSTVCSPESFRFLADLLGRLTTDPWQVNTTPKAKKPSIRQGGILQSSPGDDICNRLREIAVGLHQLADEVKRHGDAQTALAALKADFPDLAAGLVLDTPIELQAEATATTAGQHRYIGVDLGIAHAGELGSNFPYVGTNFYFRPVNKDAPFSQFDHYDQITKRFSLLLGVTTQTPAGELNRDLLGIGSLVAGGGMRVTNSLRVNAGALFFKRRDPNPLVSKTRERSTWFLSVSFDFDLKTFVGRLGGLYPSGS